MKRIALFALFLLITAGLQGQEYKPLGKVDIPDHPATMIRLSKGASGNTFSVGHCLNTRGISVDIGVPCLVDIFLKPEFPVPAGTITMCRIGGKAYPFSCYYATADRIYIEVLPEHIKHISVSGIQGIEYIFKDDSRKNTEFNMIEQELWRRTAEKVYDIIK